jgi:hypothetical protein
MWEKLMSTIGGGNEEGNGAQLTFKLDDGRHLD